MSTIEFNDALINLETYLRSFAFNFTKNEEDAKDLTQETMLKAITYRKQYTPKTNFKAWVFTIMRNLFINNYRRKVKAGTIFDNTKESYLLNLKTENHANPDNHMLGLELKNQLLNLEKEYKQPFDMHFEGYKYQEIADQLNIPIGTVKSRIHIARQKLLAKLPDYNQN
ncbi:MAG: RNA polymerase sigma factor [Crocinitomicaceae bacterium]|jgi:RNA polymerase sigma-70 factor (ECF subfamily)|nr:RNA polymerase sigma factor [Crocinitomicaceae bacterium]